MTASGESILETVRRNPGDEAAWAALYGWFRPRVAARLYNLGAGRHVADFTQEVFYRFLKHSPWRTDWASLPSEPLVMSYLLKTARSVIISAARTAAVRPSEEANDAIDDLSSGVAPDSFDIDLLLDQLKTALGPDDANLLTLLTDGASIGDIASTCGISYSAAGVRVHRLKKRMRDLLGL